LTMITRYFGGQVPYPSPTEARKPADDEIAESARRTIGEFSSHFDNFQFSRALEAAWALVGAVNKYLVENEPWTLGEKQDEVSRARLGTILYTSAEALRVVTALAHLGAAGTGRDREFQAGGAEMGPAAAGNEDRQSGAGFPARGQECYRENAGHGTATKDSHRGHGEETSRNSGRTSGASRGSKARARTGGIGRGSQRNRARNSSNYRDGGQNRH